MKWMAYKTARPCNHRAEVKRRPRMDRSCREMDESLNFGKLGLNSMVSIFWKHQLDGSGWSGCILIFLQCSFCT